MRALIFAALVAAGCTSMPASSTPPPEESSSVEALVPTCPTEWTCDFVNFFPTQPQCAGACGGQTCFQEEDCSARRFCECR
jgi:hypothetical protein